MKPLPKSKMLKPTKIKKVLIGDKYINPDVPFTRATIGWGFVSDTLTQFSSGAPRFGGRFLGEVEGFIQEKVRTNSIRNNTMVGASAPSTLPTNWSSFGSNLGTIAGTIIGTTTSNGMTVFEIKIAGTGSAGGSYTLAYEGLTVASTGQAWNLNKYLAMSAGSITNISTIRSRLTERDNGGTLILDNFGSDIKGSLTSSLQFFNQQVTLSGGASTTRVQPAINISWASAVAIDITLKFAVPQLELGIGPTSPILTTNSGTITRNADRLELNGLKGIPWFNNNHCTFVIDSNRNAADTDNGGLIVITGPVEDFNNYIQLTYESSGVGRMQYQNRYESSTNAQTTYSPAAVARRKVGITLAPNDQSLFINGVRQGQDTASILTQFQKLNIGCRFDSLELNGIIYSCDYYDYILNDKQLEQLTS